MSAFAVKIIALVSMLIDHTGCTLASMNKLSASQYSVMRSLGRIAFPLYAFLIVNGFEKTGNRAKYLTRLCIFAALSQLPYNLAPIRANAAQLTERYFFAFRTDAAYLVLLALLLTALAVSAVRKRHSALFAAVSAAYIAAGISVSVNGITLFSRELNVFYTLACSLSALCAADMLANRAVRRRDAAAAAVLSALVCAVVLADSDYGYWGLLLIAALYFFRADRALQAVSVVIWGLCLYLPLTGTKVYMLLFTALSVIPMLMYNGQSGRKTKAFYWVYPVHLFLLGMIYRLVQ